MEVVYVGENHQKKVLPSIFLAGPSPRGDMRYHWRPEALGILESLGFQGQVFVPLREDGTWLGNDVWQIDWELVHLEAASVIAFWVPRDLVHLPGFTTNVEYGLFVRSGKVVLGCPDTAVKMGYLRHLAYRFNVPLCSTLRHTLVKTIELSRIKYKTAEELLAGSTPTTIHQDVKEVLRSEEGSKGLTSSDPWSGLGSKVVGAEGPPE
jgi:hypothetical protein